MKKYLFIAMVAAVSMVFAGCEKNDPCTCNHTQTPCSFHKMTVDIPVAANEWKYDDGVYYRHVDVEALKEEAYQFGTINVYRKYHQGTNSEYQVALPETTYMVFYKDNGDGTQSVDYQYQQHVDYTIGIGFIEIFITMSDYIYDDYVPEDMYFRMQLTY